MSIVIDVLRVEIRQNTGTSVQIGKGWWLAKPVIASWEDTWVKRLKDAWRVLRGKSYAYHYAQDDSKIIDDDNYAQDIWRRAYERK
mgnify:CR=1 FL=1